jgi:hypothetical protein
MYSCGGLAREDVLDRAESVGDGRGAGCGLCDGGRAIVLPLVDTIEDALPLPFPDTGAPSSPISILTLMPESPLYLAISALASASSRFNRSLSSLSARATCCSCTFELISFCSYCLSRSSSVVR